MEYGKVFPGGAETTDCGKAEPVMKVSKCGENDCDSAETDQGYSDATGFTSLTDKNEVGVLTSLAGKFGDGLFTSRAGKSVSHDTEKVANEGNLSKVTSETGKSCSIRITLVRFSTITIIFSTI